MEIPSLALSLILIIGCTTSSYPAANDSGTRDLSNGAVRYEGPEIVAAVGFRNAEQTIGDEWLILAVEFMGSTQSGPTTISRADISARSPDGRRLALVSQEEYRKNYGRIRIAVERTLSYLPILGRYDRSQMPCDQWFLEDPGGGFARDRLPINRFQVCSGPLVFRVSGGVQPGRWRLVVELEESTADLPFVLEDEVYR